MAREIWFKDDPLDLPASVAIARQPAAVAQALRELVDALADGGAADPDRCIPEGPEAWLLEVAGESGEVVFFHCYSREGVREKTGIEMSAPPPARPREPRDVWISRRPGQWQRGTDYLAEFSVDERQRWRPVFDAILRGEPFDPALGRQVDDNRWELHLPAHTGSRAALVAAVLDFDPHWTPPRWG
jgi:hypothetical protein